MTDRFWEFFGKTVAVTACLFVLACALFFLGIARDAYYESEHNSPILLPPDSAAAKRANGNVGLRRGLAQCVASMRSARPSRL